MKRFLAFAGSRYYPSGGWEDFIGDFDTLEEASAFAAAFEEDITPYGWWNVADSESRVIAAEGDRSPDE